MKAIVEISDFFNLKGDEWCIAGNDSFVQSISKHDIIELIGKKVRLLGKEEPASHEEFDVLGAEVTTSLIGQRNITIAVDGSGREKHIQRGVVVWSFCDST